MDFESLIDSMFAQGQSSEDIADKFINTLNHLEEINKRKKKADIKKYLDDARDAVYSADEIDFTIAAKACVVAAAAYNPDLTLQDLKMLEEAYRDSGKMSVDLLVRLNKEIKGIRPEVSPSLKDDAILQDFLRTIG